MSRAMTADEVFKGSDIKITDFNDIYQAPKNKVEGSNDMSDSKLSKTELDALLRASKAEVDAVAAGMREEMAKWREEQNTQMSQLNATLSTISSKIDSKFDAVDGKIDGLKTSLTTTQWSMTIGIALVTIILSTVMIYSSSIIASAEKADTKQPQPTVIYVQQPSPHSIEQPSHQK
ncbi:hypothetical protein AB7092_05650 [Providencia rettgeri]|uniref:hypothetical protein n=1 Tax=Providencia rettgeri TaxID=587 RepID=UPI002068A814|nr:hypothetical protein [Providencia rettgeri]ELH9583132.1 hypothetical protein [Providencia rettgeri]UPS64241.1 hypothetical protein M0M83_06850 [Providencia rettgeri]